MSDADQRKHIASAPERQAGWPSALGALAVVGLAALAVLPAAWISDDAPFTLHQLRLMLRGDGIVWTPDIRVQSLTHPLWVWMLAEGRRPPIDASAAAPILPMPR